MPPIFIQTFSAAQQNLKHVKITKYLFYNVNVACLNHEHENVSEIASEILTNRVDIGLI